MLGFAHLSFSDVVKTGGRPEPRRVGVGVASTFPGFCIVHDRAFGPLDNLVLVPTPEQVALLSYRTIAREIIGKHIMMETSRFMRGADRGREPLDQVVIQANADTFKGHVDEMLPPLLRELERWHHLIATKAFDQVSAVVIQFVEPPTLQCSGAFRPDRDFDDNVVMDLNAPGCPAASATFNLLAADAHSGLAVIAWIGRFEQAEVVADSLLRMPRERVPSMLVHFSLETFDNVWMRPSWWRSLSTLKQRFLVERMMTGNMPHPSDEPPVYSLSDTGRTFAKWGIGSTTLLNR